MDVVVVPGGGLDPSGLPKPWVRERLERAIGLAEAPTPILCLSAGTTHKRPILDAYGFPLYEALASARYLIGRGVDAQRILTETCSFDTIGNAFFARVIHTDPLKLRELTVVTSEFHFLRTKAIFEWVFGLSDSDYRLNFVESANTGMANDLLRDRKARETESLARLHHVRDRVGTLKQLHRFIFTEHDAYKPIRAPWGNEISPIDTY